MIQVTFRPECTINTWRSLNESNLRLFSVFPCTFPPSIAAIFHPVGSCRILQAARSTGEKIECKTCHALSYKLPENEYFSGLFFSHFILRRCCWTLGCDLRPWKIKDSHLLPKQRLTFRKCEDKKRPFL